LFAGLIALTAGFIVARCKSAAVRVLLFVLGSLAMTGGWGSPADFLKLWIANAIFLGVVVFGVKRVVRLNLMGYFLVLAISVLILGTVELVSQTNDIYRHQGILCGVALVVLLAWPLMSWLRAKESIGVEESL